MYSKYDIVHLVHICETNVVCSIHQYYSHCLTKITINYAILLFNESVQLSSLLTIIVIFIQLLFHIKLLLLFSIKSNAQYVTAFVHYH